MPVEVDEAEASRSMELLLSLEAARESDIVERCLSRPRLARARDVRTCLGFVRFGAARISVSSCG